MGYWNILHGFLPNAYIQFRPHPIAILKILTRQSKWNQTNNPSKKRTAGKACSQSWNDYAMGLSKL